MWQYLNLRTTVTDQIWATFTGTLSGDPTLEIIAAVQFSICVCYMKTLRLKQRHKQL
jgi:hypothetical protein